MLRACVGWAALTKIFYLTRSISSKNVVVFTQWYFVIYQIFILLNYLLGIGNSGVEDIFAKMFGFFQFYL